MVYTWDKVKKKETKLPAHPENVIYSCRDLKLTLSPSELGGVLMQMPLLVASNEKLLLLEC
jgi:hypothetical protein